jgi:type II secretory pathway component GspD/PulD (secretin)
VWFPGYPATLERSTVTTVRVKSGETLVLAGLVKDEEIVTSSRVPILGDIPIIGRLFRYDKRQPQHTEIVIAITPTIKEEKG